LGYQFTQHFGIDIAYKHAFNKKVKATDNMGMGLMVEGQNEQDAVAISLNWKF
jgi:long-chain fatty acid transport protein